MLLFRYNCSLCTGPVESGSVCAFCYEVKVNDKVTPEQRHFHNSLNILRKQIADDTRRIVGNIKFSSGGTGYE